jgi:hypothetical protein
MTLAFADYERSEVGGEPAMEDFMLIRIFPVH